MPYILCAWEKEKSLKHTAHFRLQNECVINLPFRCKNGKIENNRKIQQRNILNGVYSS